jgi:molecular chaperone HscB
VLKRKFLEWQGKVHPDRLISGSTQQEDWAKTWSAIVNESYQTLNDDRLRGEYLLAKRGVEIEEQDKMEDPEMLMEILEVRESLEEAQTEEEISVIRDQNKGMCTQIRCLVSVSDHVASSSQGNVDCARSQPGG